jgi:DNA-binding response OmpR family regulator
MNGAQARILVIEDEAPIRRFLRISLESQGYIVAEAPFFNYELRITNYGLTQ